MCDILYVCMIFTSEELHAEVCYAECLLQRAALTFLQVRNKMPLTQHFLFAYSRCLSLLLTLVLPLCLG